MGKSLFASKTFWLNLLGSVAVVAGSGVVPVKYSVPALAVSNIGMRIITGEPITSILGSITK